MPLRLAQRASNTAMRLQAALPAAVCRRWDGVMTTAPQRRCPRIHPTGRPHTRAVARSARPSSMGASQHHNPALGCLSVIYFLSAPGSAVGPLVTSLPPPLCRALAPRLDLHPRALRGSQHVSLKLVGSWGRAVARPRPPRRACANPIFMAAERPRTGGCDVARPPAPLCLWCGSRAGLGQ